MEEDKKEVKRRRYELSLLVDPSLDSEAAEKYLGEIKKKVETLGGEVESGASINRIRLAYPIAKQTEAYFAYMFLNAEPETCETIIRQLAMEKQILRNVIFQKKHRTTKNLSSTLPRQKPKERTREEVPRPAPKPKTKVAAIDNEELEKKLEEILQ